MYLEVVFTQKFREVVEEDKEHPEGPLVQQSHRVRQLSIAQIGLQEAQQGDQQLLEEGPPLLVSDQLGHEYPAAHQLKA